MKKFTSASRHSGMRQLLRDMERFFGCDIPNPVNYPESFKYYAKIFKHQNSHHNHNY